jgi:hypothetical protein
MTSNSLKKTDVIAIGRNSSSGLPSSRLIGFFASRIRRDVEWIGGISLRASQELRRVVRLCARTSCLRLTIREVSKEGFRLWDTPSEMNSVCASSWMRGKERVVSGMASAETALPPQNRLMQPSTSSNYTLISSPVMGRGLRAEPK